MIYECTLPFYCPVGAVTFLIGAVLGMAIGALVMGGLLVKHVDPKKLNIKRNTK